MAKRNKQRTRSTKGNVVQRGVGAQVNPSSRVITSRGLPPKIETLSNGVVRVTNTELLDPVEMAGPHNPNGWNGRWIPMAVGNSARMGWLANISRNFQRYRFTKLSFSYVPSVGTSTDGQVNMAVVYDNSDADVWANLTNPDQKQLALSQCADSAAGPVYAGGSITAANGGGLGAANWFGVNADVGRGHRTYPWFIVSTSDVGNNQTVMCHLLLLLRGEPIPAENIRTYGQLYATYEVEFVDTISAVLAS